jgi:hypothetical protein
MTGCELYEMLVLRPWTLFEIKSVFSLLVRTIFGPGTFAVLLRMPTPHSVKKTSITRYRSFIHFAYGLSRATIWNFMSMARKIITFSEKNFKNVFRDNFPRDKFPQRKAWYINTGSPIVFLCVKCFDIYI